MGTAQPGLPATPHSGGSSKGQSIGELRGDFARPLKKRRER